MSRLFLSLGGVLLSSTDFHLANEHGAGLHRDAASSDVPKNSRGSHEAHRILDHEISDELSLNMSGAEGNYFRPAEMGADRNDQA